jgi:hypothetical protein
MWHLDEVSSMLCGGGIAFLCEGYVFGVKIVPFRAERTGRHRTLREGKIV